MFVVVVVFSEAFSSSLELRTTINSIVTSTAHAITITEKRIIFFTKGPFELFLSLGIISSFKLSSWPKGSIYIE